MKTPNFKYKDVISLDETLSPIILAGLRKFKEEIIESKYGSFPSGMFDLVGVEKGKEPTLEQDEAAWEMWLGTLDKIIYAFDPAEEPDMEEYGFEFEWQSSQAENGNSLVSIDVTDKSEYARYMADQEDWMEKCREGRMLLAEFYDSLWL